MSNIDNDLAAGDPRAIAAEHQTLAADLRSAAAAYAEAADKHAVAASNWRLADIVGRANRLAAATAVLRASGRFDFRMMLEGYTDAQFGAMAKRPSDRRADAAYLWGFDAWRQAYLCAQDEVRRQGDNYDPEVGREDRQHAAHRSAATAAYLRETGPGLWLFAQQGYSAARLDNQHEIRDRGDEIINAAFMWGYEAWHKAYWHGRQDEIGAQDAGKENQR